MSTVDTAPLDDLEQQEDSRANVLQADIAEGVADIAAGRVRELDIDEIKQRGRALLGSPTDCRRSRL
jgi:hypothetical protein